MYRAGATVDLQLDRADRAAGRCIRGPTLVVWAERYLGTRGEAPSFGSSCNS